MRKGKVIKKKKKSWVLGKRKSQENTKRKNHEIIRVWEITFEKKKGMRENEEQIMERNSRWRGMKGKRNYWK